MSTEQQELEGAKASHITSESDDATGEQSFTSIPDPSPQFLQHLAQQIKAASDSELHRKVNRGDQEESMETSANESPQMMNVAAVAELLQGIRTDMANINMKIQSLEQNQVKNLRDVLKELR